MNAVASRLSPQLQLYLFVCGAFVTLTASFLPWVCYESAACVDGYSPALFGAGSFNPLDNGGLVLLLLTVLALVSALDPTGFKPRGLKTALGTLAILFLATLFFLNMSMRGIYQSPDTGAAHHLQIGLPFALVGILLMLGTAFLSRRRLRADPFSEDDQDIEDGDTVWET